MKLGISPAPALTFVILFQLLKSVVSLHCIQCHRQQEWYSPEDNERHIHRCQKGQIEPTKCKDESHTHCIYSYYRKGGNSDITVTERRCGVAEDITGCTLYKSSKRKLRHLLTGSQPDSKATGHRRRETTLFVEVCNSGCLGDGCINGSEPPSIFASLSVLMSCISYYLFCCS